MCRRYRLGLGQFGKLTYIVSRALLERQQLELQVGQLRHS